MPCYMQLGDLKHWLSAILEGHQLDVLALGSCGSQKLSSELLQAPAFRNLRSLQIHGIQGVASQIAQFAIDLEHLLLHDVETELDIVDMCKLVKLRSLRVQSRGAILPAEPFLRIFAGCRVLQDIDVYGCVDVTPEMLRGLRKTSTLQRFRGSNVHGARLTRKDVRAVKTTFPLAEVFVDNIFAENIGVNVYGGIGNDQGSEISDSDQSMSNFDFEDEDNGVIARIAHEDPAAVIPPEEAATIESQQQAGRIERVVHHGALLVDEATAREVDIYQTEGAHEPIYLLEFTRHPDSFRAALLEGDALRACRESLHAAGHMYLLPSSAKIFVHPSQYQAAMLALHGRMLRPYHVIVAASLESQVMDCLATISCRSGARVRNRQVLNTETSQEPSPRLGNREQRLPPVEPSSEESPTDDCAIVHLVQSRTFLCVAPLMRHSDSVTQSTTEMHAGTNPRRHWLAFSSAQ